MRSSAAASIVAPGGGRRTRAAAKVPMGPEAASERIKKRLCPKGCVLELLKNPHHS
jgi:hypothetical protein